MYPLTVKEVREANVWFSEPESAWTLIQRPVWSLLGRHGRRVRSSPATVMAVQFASWIMNPVHDWLEEQVKKAVKWIGAEAEKSPPAIIWLSQL